MKFKIKSCVMFAAVVFTMILSTTQVFAAHWTKLNNDWYHFNDQNEMEKSKWVNWNNNWYHVDDFGRMQRGWYVDVKDNATYYLDNNVDTGHAYKYVNGIDNYM